MSSTQDGTLSTPADLPDESAAQRTELRGWLILATSAVLTPLSVWTLLGALSRTITDDRIVIYGWLPRALAWSGVGAALVVWFIGFLRHRGSFGRLFVLACGPAFACVAMCCGGTWIVFGEGAETVRPELTVADGGRYRLAIYSFMQGKTLRLCRVVDDSAWSLELDVVSAARFGSPRQFVRLLVPAGSSPRSPTGLCVSPAGLILVEYGSSPGLLEIYAAYDPSTDESFANVNVFPLSPFLMFRANDVGDDAALEKLAVKMLHDASLPWKAGVPDDTALAADLTHESPWVRDAAEKLIVRGGVDLFPVATERLRELR